MNILPVPPSSEKPIIFLARRLQPACLPFVLWRSVKRQSYVVANRGLVSKRSGQRTTPNTLNGPSRHWVTFRLRGYPGLSKTLWSKAK